MITLIIFFCVFTFGVIALKSGYALFNLGINTYVEDWFVIIASVVFIIRTTAELIRI